MVFIKDFKVFLNYKLFYEIHDLKLVCLFICVNYTISVVFTVPYRYVEFEPNQETFFPLSHLSFYYQNAC